MAEALSPAMPEALAAGRGALQRAVRRGAARRRDLDPAAFAALDRASGSRRPSTRWPRCARSAPRRCSTRCSTLAWTCIGAAGARRRRPRTGGRRGVAPPAARAAGAARGGARRAERRRRQRAAPRSARPTGAPPAEWVARCSAPVRAAPTCRRSATPALVAAWRAGLAQYRPRRWRSHAGSTGARRGRRSGSTARLPDAAGAARRSCRRPLARPWRRLREAPSGRAAPRASSGASAPSAASAALFPMPPRVERGEGALFAAAAASAGASSRDCYGAVFHRAGAAAARRSRSRPARSRRSTRRARFVTAACCGRSRSWPARHPLRRTASRSR